MKLLYALLLVIWWGGCTPGEVEPPPVTSTTTAPLTTTVPPEPPPPQPAGPSPSDYIKIVRVPTILEWQSSRNIGLVAGAQAMSSAGWRDPFKVLTNCPWAFEGDEPYLGMKKGEAIAFAEAGFELTRDAEDNFIPHFPEVNRRCDVNHKQYHPAFCEVTNIRKSTYAPFGALGDPNTPRGAFWVHLDSANAMRDRAGRCRSAIADAGGMAFDSITGWCTAMNDLGWRAEDCL